MNGFKTLPLVALALAACVPAGPALAKTKAHGRGAAHKTTKAAKPRPAGGADAGAAWKPDAKLLSQLQPERAFGSYLMRVPPGYTVEENSLESEKGQIVRFYLKGPSRANGSSPQMFISTALANTGYVTVSVDRLFKSDKLLDDKANVARSGVQDGSDGALDLSREYFKFQDSTDKMQWVHGFHYAATDSRSNVLIIFGDEEPDVKTTLPLAEAAVLTLRKTN